MLSVPGIEIALPAIAFLHASNLNREPLEGKRVVVIGGGGVAFDCAFTARRLGAVSVSLIFPEDADHIKTTKEELRQAEDEGIRLYPSSLASEVRNDVVAARRIHSFAFDERGELRAVFEDCPDLEIAADVVICASGLMPDTSFLDAYSPERTPKGHIIVSRDMMTSVNGLFAAGDIVTGPASVASAIGSGRRAALGMHAYLSGMVEPFALRFVQEGSSWILITEKAKRTELTRHVVDFAEIRNAEYYEHAPRLVLEAGITDEEAAAEAARCMHCGHCIDCGNCHERCPDYIIARKEGLGPYIQYPQECWHCAACRIGCPTSAINIEFPITHLV